MQLSGSKNEWIKTYSLLKILGKGSVSLGTTPDPENEIPVSIVIREDECGKSIYRIAPERIEVEKEGRVSEVSRTECLQQAEIIFEKITGNATDENLNISSCEKILPGLYYSWFQSASEDKRDFTIFCTDRYDNTTRKIAVSIKPLKWFLLSANRANNLKYDILNVKFSNPESNRINRIDGRNEVRNRLIEMERLGAKLKFTTPENKFFLENLCMIDLHFPKLLSEITRIFYTTELVSISSITEEIKQSNPFKIKDELIYKNNFYEYKVQQFLFALSTGMRSTKRYRGYGSGLSPLMIDKKGNINVFDICDRVSFDRYLYEKSHLTIGDCESHKFGYIEKENGQWLIKLNVEISL